MIPAGLVTDGFLGAAEPVSKAVRCWVQHIPSAAPDEGTLQGGRRSEGGFGLWGYGKEKERGRVRDGVDRALCACKTCCLLCVVLTSQREEVFGLNSFT